MIFRKEENIKKRYVNFSKKISEILKRIPDPNTNNNNSNRRIISKILYHYGKTDYIRNGDILAVKDNSNNLLKYGIVITPDCDLEQRSTRMIEILELRDINDSEINLNSANSVLPQLAVTCKIEAECYYQTFVQIDSEVLRNRQLRQHAKRWHQF